LELGLDEDFVRIRTTLPLSLTKNAIYRFQALQEPIPSLTLLYFSNSQLQTLFFCFSLFFLSLLKKPNTIHFFTFKLQTKHTPMAIENQENTSVREIKPKNRRIMVCTIYH